MKDGKTKYKIPGREYIQMPKALEELGCKELKARLRAAGKPVGGTKPKLVERLREHEEQTRKSLED